MIFKPGDVVFWEDYHGEIFLVLELENEKYEQYKVFILSSEFKDRIGQTYGYCLGYSAICLLKHKKLK